MRNIAIILLTFICLPTFGQVDGKTQLTNAEQLYAQNDFEGALSSYSEVESTGKFSFELYYNMGNCHFKLNDIASAILYYERAKKLDPTNEDLLFNLAFVQSKTSDKVSSLPTSNTANLYETVVSLFTIDGWAIMSVSCFIVGLMSLFIFFTLSQFRIKKFTFILSIVVMVLSASSYLFASNQLSKSKIKEGIIFSPTVNVTSTPNTNGTELFVIHEGLKVRILETTGDYFKIKLADGNVGWIEASSIRKI